MFSEILKQLLQQHHLNALTLAKQIGVPKTVVYEWRSGEREPSVENLVKLSDFFGVSLEHLTGRAEVEHDPLEKELVVLLRATKNTSQKDYEILMAGFKSHLDTYLRTATKEDHD